MFIIHLLAYSYQLLSGGEFLFSKNGILDTFINGQETSLFPTNYITYVHYFMKQTTFYKFTLF